MINKWILIVALVVAGCKTKSTEKNYIDYINDPENKITQRIKIGEVQAIMKWMPPDYYKLISRSRQAGDTLSGTGLYFNAKFEKTTGEKPVKEKLLYLDFDMQNDFVLLVGKDSIAPSICQNVENGISGSYEYMLAFEDQGREPGKQDFTVFYNDKIFGIGTIAFVYNQDDIKKIPKFKAKNENEVSNQTE